MTKVRSDANGEEAAAWVARIDAADWTAADEMRLQDWLSADHARHGALLQAQAAWMSIDHDVVAAQVRREEGKAPVIARRSIVLGGTSAIAASLIGGFFWLHSGTTYSTALGEIRKVPLADGSSATINSGSELEVRLAIQRREVRIDRGEAWFQVAKDARRPFVVQAGPVVVQAVGTAFSVRRRAAGADVLVTEGVVEIWAARTQNHIRLQAGQRIRFGNDAVIEAMTEVPSEVDRALAWRGGLIDLRGQSLADAVGEFNRYNRRQLVLGGQALATERFDGIFRTDDPEGFAEAVRQSLNVPVDLADPSVIRIG